MLVSFCFYFYQTCIPCTLFQSYFTKSFWILKYLAKFLIFIFLRAKLRYNTLYTVLQVPLLKFSHLSNLNTKVNGAKNSVFLFSSSSFPPWPMRKPHSPMASHTISKEETPWLQTLRFLTEIKQRMTKGLEVLAGEDLLY